MQLRSHSWSGSRLGVRVLYSTAGIATQSLVTSRRVSLLVDVGDGTLRDLWGDADLRSLDGILLTHGHFDHVGGLWSVLGFMRMMGRRKRLPIFAPPSSEEPEGIVNSFVKIHKRTLAFPIKILDSVDGGNTRIGDITFIPFDVEHRGRVAIFGQLERTPAVGYTISCGHERVAFSGDTALCHRLEEEVRGSDLAVLEATSSNVTGSQTHLTVSQAMKLGKTADDFLLIHRH